MNELYKREICINCANENCKERIEIKTKGDLCIEQIYTQTTIKCKDFICKNKRKKRKYYSCRNNSRLKKRREEYYKKRIKRNQCIVDC